MQCLASQNLGQVGYGQLADPTMMLELAVCLMLTHVMHRLGHTDESQTGNVWALILHGGLVEIPSTPPEVIVKFFGCVNIQLTQRLAPIL
jgi:hypothetical protein